MEGHRQPIRGMNNQNQAPRTGCREESRAQRRWDTNAQTETRCHKHTTARQVLLNQSGLLVQKDTAAYLKVVAFVLAWALLVNKHMPSCDSVAASMKVLFPD